MNEGIEALQQEGIQWVKANQSKRFSGITKLLTDLYPDNAHFIYELLQNAEDARDKSRAGSRGASVVRFTLNKDSLEFEHDGEGLFTLRDVESITGVGDSSKPDDPTSIGKFGIGFKAVFAYTATPEIHSGNYHFLIRDLVVPEGIRQRQLVRQETQFCFPFNNPKKPGYKAVEEISEALKALGDNTLLFLRCIRKIEFLLPDGTIGAQERIEHEGGHVEICSTTPDKQETISHWLRFEKTVEVQDDDEKPKDCRIAIAYRLEADEDSKKKEPWRIVPLKHGQVSIFFPAEKETSNLRFHLHAPFASTVARDSVRDCQANHGLRDQLAELVVDSLATICNQGLLDVRFLAVLPNPQDNLDDFYKPIQKAIVRAFQEKELTPTRSGSHALATGLYRGPAKIAEVLGDDDLAVLAENPRQWAANPPQQNQREDRFLDSLGMSEWGWSELALAMSYYPSYFPPLEGNDKQKRIEGWVAQKKDKWLMQFYALLGEACDVHEKCVDYADDLRIVRVGPDEGGEHVTPKEAFFPPENGAQPPNDIHFVKPTVYDVGRSESTKKHAVSFLKKIGVRPFDAKAAIELRLAEYDEAPPNEVTKTYYSDLQRFVAYRKKNPDDARLFQGHSFLLGVQANDDKLTWCEPGKLCLDNPYEETGLGKFSNIHGAEYSLWNGYQENLDDARLRDLIAFLKEIGVVHTLHIEKSGTRNNPQAKTLRQDYWSDGSRWTRWTNTAIDEDYSIRGIKEYLEAKSIPIARLIWNAIIRADEKVTKARFRPNQQCLPREAPSQLVHHLTQHAWIPDTHGNFRKPQDLTKADLRVDFLYDDRNGLLSAIGFGDKAKKRSDEYQQKDALARQSGFKDAEHMDRVMRATKGMTDEELSRMESKRESSSQQEFPKKSSNDPERRRLLVVERRENAPDEEKVIRERTIEPGLAGVKAKAKAYLRGAYTNDNNRMFCQCCHDPMPFKLPKTEQDYFEAVQFVRGLDQQFYENYLSLCPICSAKYQHACTEKPEDIKARFLEGEPDGKDTVEIEIELAGRPATLKFVGTHALDLKIILGNPRGGPG